MDIPAHERILLAFDEHDFTQSDQSFLDKVLHRIGGIKLGSVPMHARLPRDSRITVASAVGSFLQNYYPDKRRMDDPKLFDIPFVMGEAAKALSKSGSWGFTVHESNEDEGMRAAIKNCGESLVIGVGVLTSFRDQDSRRSFGADTRIVIENFARRFASLGGRALVSSGHELALLNEISYTRDLMKIVPGIRGSDDPPDDQARTMTACDAIVNGADYLVIGRPIRRAKDPIAAIDRFVEDIERGLITRFS